ncbi:hypothetical protein [Micromonospora sp. WMMD980]|uniref:hypothetical protein n=1 Tax=Micromonospora sp. WMMD980 TaxID=3016088 RepID=UPI0024168250|nr:hypothetical protein [Micromonospora sp. WMMD980]MDG4798956.1 hypothetical protein [Micromonospora sp. WMMD980]MDG4798971.1 hypothetical protein [Micromonospora sp. WMMD980]MDG4799022.1 hypothetical protein [Micromonospora sp. WMMD980]
MTALTMPAAPEVAPIDLRAIRLIAAGYTVRQVARSLGSSEAATWSRLARMRRQLGAKTLTHAVVILARAGQLDLTEITR